MKSKLIYIIAGIWVIMAIGAIVLGYAVYKEHKAKKAPKVMVFPTVPEVVKVEPKPEAPPPQAPTVTVKKKPTTVIYSAKFNGSELKAKVTKKKGLVARLNIDYMSYDAPVNPDGSVSIAPEWVPPNCSSITFGLYNPDTGTYSSSVRIR